MTTGRFSGTLSLSGLGIGIGAGLAAALLFGVVATGNPLGLVLFFVAPLPILIASLGWNHRAGIVAGVVASVALGLGLNLTAGLAFALSVGLPAWWIAYLTLLARTDEAGIAEWYPIGRLLGWIVGISAGVTMAGVLSLGLDYATYSASFERAVGLMMQINPQLFDRVPADGREAAQKEMAVLAAAIAPPLSAAFGVFTNALLVWGAARIVRASERLPRPWPVIADAELPKAALAALGVALIVSTLGGFVGLGGRTVAAAVMAGFALVGLATLHKLTQGLTMRGFALGLAYALLFILQGLPLLGAAILGILETVFRWRSRRRAPPSRPNGFWGGPPNA